MKIAVINGPNLNLQGTREPDQYGRETFESFIESLRKKYSAEIVYFQSNVEGEIVDAIQKHGFDSAGIVLNAGAYTHTSVAIADAVAAIKAPVVEVHISNIFARESYRHVSYFGARAKGIIAGFGIHSYAMAVGYLLNDGR